MHLVLESLDINEYLKSSSIIDFDTDEAIKLQAESLKLEASNKTEIELVKITYQYVRDYISHSADIGGQVVTCKASEVLKEKHGICYAKSHLLAALLRSMGIPTGFCYQKLILDDDTSPYLVIHGLNAVYIREIERWIRLDARGNKTGVDAQFSLKEEKLAFAVRKDKGEVDSTIIFSKPDKNVISTLRKCATREELFDNLVSELSEDRM